MRLNYKILFIVCLSLLLVVSTLCLVQRRLNWESKEKTFYFVDLLMAERKIKLGMTKEEAVKIIGYEPDEVRPYHYEVGSTVVEWIPANHQGWLTSKLYERPIQHSWILVLVVDRQGNVVENLSGYQ